MNSEDFKKKLYDTVPELNKLKDNHNGWEIIKKYNYRIICRNKFEIFKLIDDLTEQEINDLLKEKDVK